MILWSSIRFVFERDFARTNLLYVLGFEIFAALKKLKRKNAAKHKSVQVFENPQK